MPGIVEVVTRTWFAGRSEPPPDETLNWSAIDPPRW
jgi:hypothetical protein